MKPDDEPALAPTAASGRTKSKRVTVGKGLLLFFLAFACLMFAIYATIIIWTGVTAV